MKNSDGSLTIKSLIKYHLQSAGTNTMCYTYNKVYMPITGISAQKIDGKRYIKLESEIDKPGLDVNTLIKILQLENERLYVMVHNGIVSYSELMKYNNKISIVLQSRSND